MRPGCTRIREFVLQNPGCTAVELRDALGEYVETDTVFCFSHPDRRKGNAFFIANVTKEFYDDLREMMRGEDVVVTHNPLAAMVSDTCIYRSYKGMHYMPVTIRISSNESRGE